MPREIAGEIDSVARQVVDSAFAVHKALGPGLLESVYEACLDIEFTERRIPFRRQVPLPISYKGREIGEAYRLDFLVGGTVILELKAVEQILPIHEAQLLSYLKLSGHRLGFLINFNVPVIKSGIKRMAF
ncbi:MAG TPA: GxxExxY protein [Burkholderiales bacterium]|nr:GxxExxY protein [Burkholderiales bacterium]